MSVSIRVFEQGKKVSEEIYAGASIKVVIDYLDECCIPYQSDQECEDAYEITKNKDVKIMCIDNTNVLGVEATANFISEYLLEYDEKTHKDLVELLS